MFTDYALGCQSKNGEKGERELKLMARESPSPFPPLLEPITLLKNNLVCVVVNKFVNIKSFIHV